MIDKNDTSELVVFPKGDLKIPVMLLVMIAICIIITSDSIFAQDISDVFEQVNSSVVMIVTYDATGSEKGQGSGVIINANGIILTNNHVVENAYSARVITEESEYNDVRVLYEDENYDLALIGVSASNLRPISFTANRGFRAGQRVIAIGNPLGFEKTISDGLISGVRKIETLELIQTTVPISPGSSGGVLLNEAGELIGLTTATIEEGQNLNFAISLNTISHFLDTYSHASKYDYNDLKPAGTSIWYRVVLKWVGNILVILISILFGGAFYIVIPVLIGVGYILYYIVKGAINFLRSIIGRGREKQIINSSSLYSTQSSYAENNEFCDEGDGGYNHNKLLPDSTLDSDEIDDSTYYPELSFFCWKCGDKITLGESVDDKVIICENCGSANSNPHIQDA